MSGIPYEKLTDGYEKCLNLIHNHIRASEIVYTQKNYCASIPLSILATEESYKIVMFQQHLISKEGISEKRWEKVSRSDAAHRHKLTSILADSKAEIKNNISKEDYDYVAEFQEALYGAKVLPYSVAAKVDAALLERLAALNEVKKACFYLAWDGAAWSNFMISASETEQEAVAAVELNTAKFMLMSAKRWLKWPKFPNLGTSEFAAFVNDDLTKEDIMLHQQMKSPEHQTKIGIANSVLDRYRTRKTKSHS